MCFSPCVSGSRNRSTCATYARILAAAAVGLLLVVLFKFMGKCVLSFVREGDIYAFFFFLDSNVYDIWHVCHLCLISNKSLKIHFLELVLSALKEIALN